MIFLFNFLSFLVGVLFYLLHGFFVVLHHLSYLSLELLDLILLDLHEVVVVLLLLIHSSSVLFEQIGLRSLVRPRLFFFLALEFLVLAGIFKHLSTIFGPLLL